MVWKTARINSAHERTVQRQGPACGLQPDVYGEIDHGEHYSSSLVSSTVGSPSVTPSFFWASIMISARSSLRRKTRPLGRADTPVLRLPIAAACRTFPFSSVDASSLVAGFPEALVMRGSVTFP
jgi:hypothetical protein